MDRFERWIEAQRQAGTDFSEEQWQWLNQIAQHIATSVRIEAEDFEYGWFADRGQLGKAHQLFGDRLTGLLDELNRELVA
jgi:type I restriction enzyme R subunit